MRAVVCVHAFSHPARQAAASARRDWLAEQRSGGPGRSVLLYARTRAEDESRDRGRLGEPSSLARKCRERVRAVALCLLGLGLGLWPAPAGAEPPSAVVAASVPVSAWAERALLPPGWTTDEQGRVLRVSFDPGARWLLGAGYAPRHGAGGAQPELAQIETGLAYRHRIDFPGEGISYKLYHRVLAGRAVAGPRSPWEIDAALYEGRFLRWSRDGSIMLPTNPPRRMLLPLNIGVEATLGRIDLAPRPAGPAAEIGVVRAELLLDLWRRRAMGSYAELGLGPRYDLRLGGDDAAAVRHVVAPFTQGSFTFHHETADGLHGVEARLSGGPALSVAERWGARAEAVVSYEAILVAVNDLPLSAYAELGYRYEGLPAPAGGVPEVRATTGLRFAVPLR